MLKVNRKFAIFICCFFLITIVSSAAAEESMFVCDLAVNKIGPKPADTKAKGSVIFLFDEAKQELTYKLMVEKIEDVYMAHLHIGSPDKQGPMAAWLYPVDDHQAAERIIAGEFNGTLADGVIRPEDLEDGISFEEMMQSLGNGNAYVNVHTKEFYMGAIRGQVYPEEIAGRMEENPTAAGTK